jgi:hypothetical protein
MRDETSSRRKESMSCLKTEEKGQDLFHRPPEMEMDLQMFTLRTALVIFYIITAPGPGLYERTS